MSPPGSTKIGVAICAAERKDKWENGVLIKHTRENMSGR
jgi:hypothetical protein